MPQGNTLNWVKTFSATHWIAAGNNGTFIRTTNAGASWDIFTNAGGTSPTTKQGKNLYTGWFFDASTGLVCGINKWIARTTNGGTNWDSIGTLVTDDYTVFEAMHFINNATGFIGGGLVILKTINGGLNWTALPGINASVRCIYALDENNIFFGTTGYFLKTTNGGNNWITYSTGIYYTNEILFSDINTGFICSNGGTIFVTTNGGVSWVSKETTLSSSNSIYKTYLPYGNSFIENFNGTVFPPSGWRAVNVLGNSIVWVRSTTGPHSSPASALIINDCNISTGGGLDWLISPQIHINSGDTLSFWMKPLLTGFTDSLCVRVSASDTALSSFTTRVLYLADGAGYPASSVWTNYKVSLNSLAGQNVYIGFKHQDMCGDGIFLDDVSVISQTVQSLKLYVIGDPNDIAFTTNLGDNWTKISILEPFQKYSSNWNSMSMVGSIWAMCGYDGIFNVSTNNGTNWTTKNNRLVGSIFYDVWCFNGNGKVWAVGSQSSENSSDQVLYSSNGGVTFQPQTVSGSKSTYESICMVNENTGYICGSYGAVRRTFNSGQTWDSLFTSIPNNNYLNKIDFVNINTGWVFSSSTNAGGPIWKTTNSGLIWTAQSLTDTASGGKSISTADMINENLGFCISQNTLVHMTTNGGNNWSAKTPRLYSGFIYEINMVSASAGYACGTGKLFRTTNQWASYDTIIMPFTHGFSAIKWLDMNNGFAASGNGFVLRTTNGGNVWEFMLTSVSGVNGMFVKAIDTAYIVGGYGNILKLGRGPVGTTTSWENNIPEQYYLGQNYPNPFNPVTEFKFGLYNKAKVSLKVYDITGRLVQTYFDNLELNAGTITVKFDGSNLASGVYFYTLFVDDSRINTKKMVLIK